MNLVPCIAGPFCGYVFGHEGTFITSAWIVGADRITGADVVTPVKPGQEVNVEFLAEGVITVSESRGRTGVYRLAQRDTGAYVWEHQPPAHI